MRYPRGRRSSHHCRTSDSASPTCRSNGPPHFTVLRDWFEKLPTKTWRAFLRASAEKRTGHAAKLTVGVLEDYRRHGIGSHLLHRGLEWAAAQGYRKVYNSIPATNQEAARFLEEHGFETEAIRKDHYMIDDEFVAELMMAKTL